MCKCENMKCENQYHIVLFPHLHIIGIDHIYTLIKMNKVTAYFSESYKELVEKVTWPTWTQLQQSTLIVLTATLLIMLLVFSMDLICKGLLNFVYSLLK